MDISFSREELNLILVGVDNTYRLLQQDLKRQGEPDSYREKVKDRISKYDVIISKILEAD